VQLLHRHAAPGAPRPAPTAGPGLGTSIWAKSASVHRVAAPHLGALEPVVADLERADRLLEALLEGAPDRHHLAHRLHLRRQRAVGLRELLEGEARDLGHDVVDGRLEAGRRLAGDVVADLVERVADGQLGGDLGDREAGRLGGQRRRARDARVHLDDHQRAVLGVHRELDVRAAGVDADLADDRERRVAHLLVFLVGQRLGRRDGDRVAGVHAHRVEVLDRADDDDVVGGRASPRARTPSSPARSARAGSGGAATAGGPSAPMVELGVGPGDAAAGAAQREARAG
jgi:hypothetical protein